MHAAAPALQRVKLTFVPQTLCIPAISTTCAFSPARDVYAAVCSKLRVIITLRGAGRVFRPAPTPSNIQVTMTTGSIKDYTAELWMSALE